MPQYTSNMDLYKVDLETDGNSTFNIKTMLNDNWDKIDSKYDEQEGRIRGNSEVVNEVKEDIGDKSELKTEEKSSLVGAVNEVSTGMADIANQKANYIGNTKTIDFVQKDNGNSGSSKTIDWTQSNKQNINVNANTTLTFTSPNNACNLMLVITYTGTYTITLPEHKTVGGNPLEFSSADGKRDLLSLYYDGIDYYCMLSADWQ
ncbi:hypothetical protein [Vallitalea guaymasensis]|uniref:Tail fiber protein n=1 Tax=Vallitalea guaymasensis TaxID=1185412 RepID=A0A8J8SD16_9FIRM|nr:hypothetical protein [Vallitalea guaymasensis]QUH29996.1 hypothetical protein HYG85_14165 [Vallitalea guaymasensis]